MMKFLSIFASTLLLGKHFVLADVVSVTMDCDTGDLSAEEFNASDGPGPVVRDTINVFFHDDDFIPPGAALDDSDLKNRRLSEADDDQEDLIMPESIEDVAPPIEEEDSNRVALRGSRISRRLAKSCPDKCNGKKWKLCKALGCKCTCGGRRRIQQQQQERGYNSNTGNFMVHELKNDINAAVRAVLAIEHYDDVDCDIDIERQHLNDP
jgi:hypothetical protein